MSVRTRPPVVFLNGVGMDLAPKALDLPNLDFLDLGRQHLPISAPGILPEIERSAPWSLFGLYSPVPIFLSLSLLQASSPITGQAVYRRSSH